MANKIKDWFMKESFPNWSIMMILLLIVVFAAYIITCMYGATTIYHTQVQELTSNINTRYNEHTVLQHRAIDCENIIHECHWALGQFGGDMLYRFNNVTGEVVADKYQKLINDCDTAQIEYK